MAKIHWLHSVTALIPDHTNTTQLQGTSASVSLRARTKGCLIHKNTDIVWLLSFLLSRVTYRWYRQTHTTKIDNTKGDRDNITLSFNYLPEPTVDNSEDWLLNDRQYVTMPLYLHGALYYKSVLIVYDHCVSVGLSISESLCLWQ